MFLFISLYFLQSDHPPFYSRLFSSPASTLDQKIFYLPTSDIPISYPLRISHFLPPFCYPSKYNFNPTSPTPNTLYQLPLLSIEGYFKRYPIHQYSCTYILLHPSMLAHPSVPHPLIFNTSTYPHLPTNILPSIFISLFQFLSSGRLSYLRLRAIPFHTGTLSSGEDPAPGSTPTSRQFLFGTTSLPHPEHFILH